VQSLAQLTEDSERRSGMNFVVTNGQILLATRHEKSLFFAAGPSTDARPPESGTPLRQLVVASEQLSLKEPWFTVRPDEVVGVDAQMRFQRWEIGAL
jgi:glutamine amidotransferase